MAEAEHTILIPSRQELLKARGNLGLAYQFIERNTLDMYHVKYDFDGDLIPGDATSPGKFEIVTNNSGTLILLADQVNGVARLDTIGSTTNDYCNLTLPELNMQAQLSCTIAVRLSVVNVSDCKVEVGFNDITTDAGLVDDLSGETFTAGNFATWVWDTNDGGNPNAWQGVSAKAGALATSGKFEPSGLPLTYPDTGVFQTLIVALFADSNTQHAKYILLDANGNKVIGAESTWSDAAITHNTQLVPWVGITTRTSSNKQVDLDFIELWQRRTVT